jgi:hypothetical protein
MRPIHSPVWPAPASMQKPFRPRVGSSASTSNWITRMLKRRRRYFGTRPMAPSRPSKLNIETLPSVAP